MGIVKLVLIEIPHIIENTPFFYNWVHIFHLRTLKEIQHCKKRKSVSRVLNRRKSYKDDVIINININYIAIKICVTLGTHAVPY